MITKKIYASEIGAKLNSNVYTGGGTDDTAVLQAVLDKAPEIGGVHLIMDGAALVSQLKLHSNTTIECLNADCGFFQLPQSNCAIVTNYNWDRKARNARNITLLGGTYNQNCPNQLHDVPATPEMLGANCYEGIHGVVGIEFCGVENLVVRDLKILDFRTYAFMLTNFFRATIENVWVDLPNRMVAQNQDGLHFWGPGQFLTVRDCGGTVGDDFMNIGPDEGDGVSSITDVLVDGIFLNDADQALRLLSRGTGRLDRVTIRNVSGTYRSFGFYINPWLYGDDIKGNYGHITIENVDLAQANHIYHYSVPLLFRLGGQIEKLTLKNIHHKNLTDEHAFLQIGGHYDAESKPMPFPYTKVGTLEIDGMEILGNSDGPTARGIEVKCEVDNLIVNRAILNSMNDMPMIKVFETGSIKNLMLSQIIANGHTLIEGEDKVGKILKTDILA